MSPEPDPVRRAGWIALALGVAALLAALLLSGPRHGAMLASYLPAWLFFLSLPLGALPLLMVMELAGAGLTPLAAALRRVVVALPLAALLALPLLLHLRSLYGWADRTLPGFAGRWLDPRLFTLREAAFLVVWAALGLVFAYRPSLRSRGWRPGLAVLGLMLHLAMGTVAAVDWAMSLEPGLDSSVFGLLVIAAQCGTALSAAVLLAAALGDRRAVAAAARPMLALLGAWVFLQFSQYLVVWSANLPGEIVWYQHRGSGFGLLALAGCIAALAVLLPRRFAGDTRAVATIAALVLLLHMVESLWLVTPAWRGAFTIGAADLLLMLGVGGVVCGGVLAIQRPGGSLGRA